MAYSKGRLVEIMSSKSKLNILIMRNHETPLSFNIGQNSLIFAIILALASPFAVVGLLFALSSLALDNSTLLAQKESLQIRINTLEAEAERIENLSNYIKQTDPTTLALTPQTNTVKTEITQKTKEENLSRLPLVKDTASSTKENIKQEDTLKLPVVENTSEKLLEDTSVKEENITFGAPVARGLANSIEIIKKPITEKVLETPTVSSSSKQTPSTQATQTSPIAQVEKVDNTQAYGEEDLNPLNLGIARIATVTRYPIIDTKRMQITFNVHNNNPGRLLEGNFNFFLIKSDDPAKKIKLNPSHSTLFRIMNLKTVDVFLVPEEGRIHRSDTLEVTIVINKKPVYTQFIPLQM